MFKVEFDVDVDADEYGIFDGRQIALQMIYEALQLVLPYADNDPEKVANMMHALVNGGSKLLEKFIEEHGDMPWRIASDTEITGPDPLPAMRRHCLATQAYTDALIESVEGKPAN